jgi:hypothetical protein
MNNKVTKQRIGTGTSGFVPLFLRCLNPFPQRLFGLIEPALSLPASFLTQVVSVFIPPHFSSLGAQTPALRLANSTATPAIHFPQSAIGIRQSSIP